jgi:phosphoadenosine phosphosulfate reductase
VLAERNLFKDGAFIADPFRAWAEGDDPAAVRYTHMSAAGVPRQPRGGARQSASARPAGFAGRPGRGRERRSQPLRLVAVHFPAFTDGRGYSSARLLSERYGYKGEIRAVGDVLADQVR